MKTKLACGRPLAPLKESRTEKKQSATVYLNSCLEKLNHHLQEKNLKHSEVRDQILKVIVEEARHFTAVELLPKLQENYPGFGKATLYRNLPVLVEAGVLQEGPPDKDGNPQFELTNSTHHDHLVCEDCGEIFEFHDEVIETQQARLAKKMSFEVSKHQHVIYVKCAFRSGAAKAV